MRKKYFVKSDDGWTVALRYDSSVRELVVGGYRALAPKTTNILTAFFDVDPDAIKLCSAGGRVRLAVGGVSLKMWEEGLTALGGEYALIETRSFRRLCR